MGGYLSVFCLYSFCALCVLCFPKLFFFSGDHFSAKLKDMRGDADKHFLAYHPFEDGEDKQHPVWSWRKRSRIELI